MDDVPVAIHGEQLESSIGQRDTAVVRLVVENRVAHTVDLRYVELFASGPIAVNILERAAEVRAQCGFGLDPVDLRLQVQVAEGPF